MKPDFASGALLVALRDLFPGRELEHALAMVHLRLRDGFAVVDGLAELPLSEMIHGETFVDEPGEETSWDPSGPTDLLDYDDGDGHQGSAESSSNPGEHTAGGPRFRAAGSPNSVARGRGVVPAILAPTKLADRAVPDGYQSVPGDWTDPRTADRPVDLMPTQSLLYSLTRTRQPGREPDIEATVREIASGLPLDKIPPEVRAAGAKRISFLVDKDLAIGPCARDTDSLADLLAGLVGEARLDKLSFRSAYGLPCGRGPVWTWKPLASQRLADSVVLVSGGRLSRAPQGRPHLDAAARQLRDRGHQVLVLLFGSTDRLAPAPYQVVHIDE
jgi:hypothetical protein